MARLLFLRFTLALLTVVTGSSVARAQVQAVKLETAGPSLPQASTMVVLIRSALVALNNANLTGNYTVLRALGSKGFQSANTPANLAAVFTKLRNRKLDLAPALLYQPKLMRQPSINGQGMLHLTGYFSTRPEQVNFDFGFQLEDGRWRLFAILVNVARVKPALAKSDARKTKKKAAISPSVKSKKVTAKIAKASPNKIGRKKPLKASRASVVPKSKSATNGNPADRFAFAMQQKSKAKKSTSANWFASVSAQ